MSAEAMKSNPGAAVAGDTAQRFHPSRVDFGNFKPQHFLWQLDGKVATVMLNRPERKNPLTLESYAELRDTFRDLVYAEGIKSVVIAGAGGNFCSGGDVHEIIGPLVEMQRKGDMAGLLAFTRMTGDLVKAMRACPQPIVAAIDGICAGAGAILAMASDLRYGTARSKVAFLFVRVGLAGADMGACNMLPRIIGAGRAAELLYTGRAMDGGEAGDGLAQTLEPVVLGERKRWLSLSPTADLARNDQALHPSGVEHGDRRLHRSRSASTGDMHADEGLRTGLRGVRQER
jgi:enoyl-CoA hydratase/carnithine racemase